MAERGIYLPDGTFMSEGDIKRRLAHQETRAEFLSRIPKSPDLKRYLEIAKERANQANEMSSRNDGTISVGVVAEAIIAYMGDFHLGHPNVDHKRIEDEVNAVAGTKGAYVAMMGDMVDGVFFGGSAQGENTLNITEQHGLLKAIRKTLNGKVLFGVGGEHDQKWASKTGADPYANFSEETGAPAVRGIVEAEIKSGDDTWNVVAAHKMRGHSMYNKTHPDMRQSRFGIQGADVYVSAHTHQKGVAQEQIRDFGEDSHEVTHISIGPYKSGDEYSQREGFPKQTTDEQGGVATKLTKRDGKKHVETDPDIVSAIKKWTE